MRQSTMNIVLCIFREHHLCACLLSAHVAVVFIEPDLYSLTGTVYPFHPFYLLCIDISNFWTSGSLSQLSHVSQMRDFPLVLALISFILQPHYPTRSCFFENKYGYTRDGRSVNKEIFIRGSCRNTHRVCNIFNLL